MHTKDRSLKANEWSSSHTWMFSSSQKFPGHPLCSLPFLFLLSQRTPLSERIPSPPNLPCFPSSLASHYLLSCAPFRQCVILTHHHGRAVLLATCPCSFFMAEKGSPSSQKMNGKNLPGWS